MKVRNLKLLILRAKIRTQYNIANFSIYQQSTRHLLLRRYLNTISVHATVNACCLLSNGPQFAHVGVFNQDGNSLA